MPSRTAPTTRTLVAACLAAACLAAVYLAAACLAAVAATGCRAAPSVEPDLRAALHGLVAEQAPHEISIAYLDLETGARLSISGDVVMHAASTMKVPVMIELFRQAEAGAFSLDDPLRVENEFASIVDGSPYSLTAASDSDVAIYEHVGEELPIRDLLHRMIARSSNLATNLLIALCDPKRVQATMESLGTTRMQVLRGVEDTKAYRAGRSNTTTANDLMRVMAAIARGDAASRESCAEMLRILSAQEFNDLIPAGLPAGTEVAHKTGWITRIRHDAAIVDPGGERPYVLVVLTRGFTDMAKAAAAIAAVARCVHEGR